jgi:hypothetical protein
MYSIQNIVYGVPLTSKAADLIKLWESEDDERWTDEEEGQCGFVTLYHGGASGLVGYCGVLLGELDECCAWLRLEEHGIRYKGSGSDHLVRTKPNNREIKTAERRVAALHPDLRKLCPKIGVYVVFSTS